MTLAAFLANYAVTNQEFNLVSVTNNKKYSVPEELMGEFWGAYCSSVGEFAEGMRPPMMEKVGSYSTATMSATIIVSMEFDEPTIIPSDSLFYRQTAAALCEVLEDQFNVESSDLVVYVTALRHDERFYTVRFVAPRVCILKTHWTNILRKKVLQLVRQRNISAHLPSAPLQDWTHWIKASTVNLPVRIYDTTEDLVGVFDLDGHEVGQGEVNVGESWFAENNCLNDELLDDTELSLPLILSINGLHRESVGLRKSQASSSSSSECSRDSFSTRDLAPVYTTVTNVLTGSLVIRNDIIQITEELMPMVGHHRGKDDTSWKVVGQSLFRVFSGSAQGLELWRRFTRDAGKFDPEDCNEHYYTFHESKYSHRTIGWFARSDSPKLYLAWLTRRVSSLIERWDSKVAHAAIARAFAAHYWLELVCVPNAGRTKHTWYRYRQGEHFWTRLDGDDEIRDLISRDFVCVVEDARISLLRSKTDYETGSDDAKKLDNKVKVLGTIVEWLQNDGYQKSLISQIAGCCRDSCFEKYRDSDPDTFGVVNGVIQLTKTHAFLRDGIPEDYIVMHSSQFVNPNLPEDHRLMRELLTWLRRIFGSERNMRAFLRWAAACMRGFNDDKKLYGLEGVGNNSKSLLILLFEKAFGEYCSKVSSTALTQGRKSAGQANPELAQLRGVRVTFINEPDSGDTLRAGVVKEIRGNDTMYVRALFDNGGVIKNMSKFVIVCNFFPRITKADLATKASICILPCKGRWPDTKFENVVIPDSVEEQERLHIYPQDGTFIDKVPSLAGPFLSLLIHAYSDFAVGDGKGKAICIPPDWQEAIDLYWERSDFYEKFIDQFMDPVFKPIVNGIREPDTSVSVLNGDAFAAFRTWFNPHYPDLVCPAIDEFQHEIERRINQKQKHGRWYGWKLRDSTQPQIE